MAEKHACEFRQASFFETLEIYEPVVWGYEKVLLKTAKFECIHCKFVSIGQAAPERTGQIVTSWVFRAMRVVN